MIHQKITTILV